jgi:hypothetical protein
MTLLIALTLTIGAIAVVWNLYAWQERASTAGNPSDAGLHLLIAVAIAGGLILVMASLRG